MERTSPVARAACALAVSLCCAAAYGHTAVVQVSADAFKRGVVKIRSQTPAHGDESGAGIIVGRDAHLVVIVTARHVVMDAPQVEVVFFDKPYKEFQGKPFRKYHEELDIAVVIVDVGQEPLIPPDLPRVSVGDMARLKEGEKVSIIGHPLDQEWQASLNTNSLAGLSDQEDARKLRLTRTALERGNSGGPVFTERGALITDGVSLLQTNKNHSTYWPYCRGHALPPHWLKACNPARNGGVYDHHQRVYHGVVL